MPNNNTEETARIPEIAIEELQTAINKLNKRWRKRIIDTDYINERAIKTTILVNRRRIDLMSVYFPHSKYADHHVEKMYKTIEKHMTNSKKCILIIGGDFNAELGPGKFGM